MTLANPGSSIQFFVRAIRAGTSAIIPLLADEPPREGLLAILEDDPQIVAWWSTSVEIASALARRERERRWPFRGYYSALGDTSYTTLPPRAS